MPQGTVVLYPTRDPALQATHETRIQERVARMVADVNGAAFAGTWELGGVYEPPVVFVPTDTIVGFDHASTLGIRSGADLFGGVVPHAFVKTKAIAHPLVAPTAARPEGWSDAFADAVTPLVLPGFTAFSRDDALVAARRLLRDGAVRLKRPLASGGRGQVPIHSAGAAARALDDIAPDELTEAGVVLETNLRRVRTYSVGQSTAGDFTVSYYGVQRETRDNAGHTVYGGSDLVLFRGGFDGLWRRRLPVGIRRAIRAALAFDRATSHYRVLASRRNYDVGDGLTPDGQRVIGVFEQSWRIGGASAAELLAFQAFREDPWLERVEASTVEAYGPTPEIPASASIHFHGEADGRGSLVCYSLLRRAPAAA